jgi:peptidoglycan/xylan/chitin deacetylase (PgdA/CDA1 family)
MNQLFIFCAVAVLIAWLPASAQNQTGKIVIIKADDIRRASDGWDRFFALSREKNIKVSAGIICNSLEDAEAEYVEWLRKLQASGMIEFWNHGWDHKRWTNDENEKIREFAGTGYDHQKKHFDDAQKIMEQVLGVPPVAFGTPYNASDSDTVRIMKENPDMRLFFCYKSEDIGNKLVALMSLRGENDGTGKPNFEKFKEQYFQNEGLTFTALQFHPNNFDEERLAEYGKIVDFLTAEGWTFMLPTEYVAMLNKTKT